MGPALGGNNMRSNQYNQLMFEAPIISNEMNIAQLRPPIGMMD